MPPSIGRQKILDLKVVLLDPPKSSDDPKGDTILYWARHHFIGFSKFDFCAKTETTSLKKILPHKKFHKIQKVTNIVS